MKARPREEKGCRSIVEALLITMLSVMSVPAADPVLVGSWPGYARSEATRCVAVSGAYAYVGSTAGLHVIDISRPNAPRRVGGFENLGVNDVAVSGDYAFLACGGYGLVVIDIANPTKPALKARFITTDHANGLAMSGNYAFVASFSSGLQIIDVSNPAKPFKAGEFDTSGIASGVALSGDYAYVADGPSGLQVIDIRNPAHPIQAGGYDSDGFATDVAVLGRYVYVSDEDAGFLILDISNAAKPARASSYKTSGSALGVAVSGIYAYVGDVESGLQILDVSNPARPLRVASLESSRYCFDMVVLEGLAYVADAASGLEVIDVSKPFQPRQVSDVVTSGNSLSVSVSGDFALLGEDLFLRIIDIRDPAQPSQVGAYFTGAAGAYKIASVVEGNQAYLAAGAAGLHLIDLSNPAAPRRVAVYDTSGLAQGVAVAGNIACVADGEAGLQVIDLSDRTNPKHIGGYDTSGNAYGIAVAGAHAYVADGDGGLRIFDIRNPTAPMQVGVNNSGGFAYDVAVSGAYAYVAGAALEVIDIADPANPVRVGRYATAGFSRNVSLRGGTAYVIDDGRTSDFEDPVSSLRVIDVTNPAKPSLLGAYNTPGWALSAAALENHAYLADRDHGLLVLRIPNENAGGAPGSSHLATLPHGYSLIGNHFIRGGNKVAEVLPSVPAGTILYKYGCETAVGYSVNQFVDGRWSRPTDTLAPGEGALVFNPSASAELTFSGEPPSNSRMPPLLAGWNLMSLPIPGVSSIEPREGDRLFTFNFLSQSYEANSYELGEWILPLKLERGQGFFYMGGSGGLPPRPCDPAPRGGSVYFNNRVPAFGINAPFSMRAPGGMQVPLGSEWRAQLYGGASPASMAPVGSSVPLSTGANAGFVDLTNDSGVRYVPTVGPGEEGFFQIRYWQISNGATFEAAVASGSGCFGESSIVRIRTGGDGGPPSPPANLAGLAGGVSGMAALILQGPTNQTQVVGAEGVFVVETVFLKPGESRFQWQKQESNQAWVDIIGANSASYRLTNLRTSDAGSYRVKVSTACQEEISSAGNLVVIAPRREFGPNSGRLTNPYIPWGVGLRFTFRGFDDAAGIGMFFETLALETVDGVECLKVRSKRTNDAEQLSWLAQDTEGNVWELRDFDGRTGEVEDTDALYMPASPRRGKSYELFDPPAFVSAYAAISLTELVNVPLRVMPDCLHLQYEDAEEEESYYFAPGVGLIKWAFTGSENGGWALESIEGTDFNKHFPAILEHPPDNVLSNPGTSVTLAVRAIGTQPVSYQWRKDGEDIPNSNSPAHIIGSLSVETSGAYSVLVANSQGLVESEKAAVEVRFGDAATVRIRPLATMFTTGQPLEFAIETALPPPLKYSWYLNGLLIPGVTSSVLKFPERSTGPHLGGYYNAVVESPSGVMRSEIAQAAFYSLKMDRQRSGDNDWLRLNVVKSPGNDYLLERSTDLLKWEIEDDSQRVVEGVLSTRKPRLAPPAQQFYRFKFLGPAKALFFSSFEELSADQRNLSAQFSFDRDQIKSVSVFGTPLHESFTEWDRTNEARTGMSAINVIPRGNPLTHLNRVVSAGILRSVFDFSGLKKVRLYFHIKTTSNPRLATEHNCDSGLRIYIRRDNQPWSHVTTLCGAHKSESIGWRPILLDIEPRGTSKLELAFTYELQNSPAPDPQAVFLLDDLAILGE